MSGSNANLDGRQCAFDMTKSTAARDFEVVLGANKYLRENTNFGYRNNELLFDAWDSNKPKDLPIEAFFYLMDYNGAKERAMMFRINYFKQTGVQLPVVGIRLPTPSTPIQIVNAN